MDICTEHLKIMNNIERELIEAKNEIGKLKTIAEANQTQIALLVQAALSQTNLLKYVVTPLIIIIGVLAGVKLIEP